MKEQDEAALKRIETVGGSELAAAMNGRSAGDVSSLAEMTDDDIKKVRGLVSLGWSVRKASAYKMTQLKRTNSIRDLCVRAVTRGVARCGSFHMEIMHDNVPLLITVTKSKR